VGLEIASGTPEAVQERFNDTRMTRFECRLPNRPDIATAEHKAWRSRLDAHPSSTTGVVVAIDF